MSLVGEVDGTAARQASLKLLQRKDPGIHEIIANASHVSVYVFDNKTGSWDRKDVEGSLFIVKRITAPFFQLIVLNRLNFNNMVQSVSENMRVKILQQYLMFLSPDPCVYGESITQDQSHGVWFHSDAERQEIFSVMEKAIADSRILPKPATSTIDANQSAAALLLQTVSQPQPSPVQVQTPAPAAAAPANFLLPEVLSKVNLCGPDQGAPTSVVDQPASRGHDFVADPLTQGQLKDTLMALLDDDRFVTMLHTQYLSRVKKMNKQP